MHSDYYRHNLQADLASEKSIWRFYRDLLKLRRDTPALTQGSFTELSPQNGGYCAYCRQLGQDKILVICNFEQEQQIALGGPERILLLSNYGHGEKKDFVFRPYELAVYRIRSYMINTLPVSPGRVKNFKKYENNACIFCKGVLEYSSAEASK